MRSPIDFSFWALCFLSVRNDLDSKYKELCNRCAACADLIRIQGLTLGLLPVSPSAGYQRNRLNGGVKNVTDSDVKPTLKRGHYAVEVDLPPVTGSYMSSEEAGQSRSCNAWAL